MPYDNTCKYLAETFPTDFAAWLLGKPIPLTKLEPSELSTEPIRADSLIFLESSELILHIEFQTSPDAAIPFRMADYRLRLYRKYPQRSVHQVVIYLKFSNSDLVLQDQFTLPNLSHRFNVIRMWEQPQQIFQQSLGLLPLAVLSQTSDRIETLQAVAKQIENVRDRNMQSNLTASTYLISGLVLNNEVISHVLRSNVMKESVTYQAILQEGEMKGKAEGRAEGEAEGEARGKAEATKQVAINMLKSGLSVDLIAQFTGLSLEEIAKLQS